MTILKLPICKTCDKRVAESLNSIICSRCRNIYCDSDYGKKHFEIFEEAFKLQEHFTRHIINKNISLKDFQQECEAVLEAIEELE